MIMNPGLLEEDDIKTPRLQETKTKTCCCNQWGSSTEDSKWYLVFVVKFVDLADITITITITIRDWKRYNLFEETSHSTIGYTKLSQSAFVCQLSKSVELKFLDRVCAGGDWCWSSWSARCRAAVHLHVRLSPDPAANTDNYPAMGQPILCLISP